MERRMFRRLDAVIFVSQLAKEKLVSANPCIGQMTTYAILNSIPPRPESVHTPIDRKSLGIDDQTPVIIFAGRVRKSKGVTTLLKALALCNDLPFHLLIIGKFRSERYRREILKIIDREELKKKVSII
ncbi:MAG: glycosyltransferase, partial [Muribaculum sp.]|nr:glycosyltransferase [Muribaculum sp.]